MNPVSLFSYHSDVSVLEFSVLHSLPFLSPLHCRITFIALLDQHSFITWLACFDPHIKMMHDIDSCYSVLCGDMGSTAYSAHFFFLTFNLLHPLTLSRRGSVSFAL